MTAARDPSVTYQLEADDGSAVVLQGAPGEDVRARLGDVVGGRTYPHLPFVEDVRVIVDVDAGCGAAVVHFARHHPDAQIHAFEADPEEHARLVRNVGNFGNVRVHPRDAAPTALSQVAELDPVDVLRIDVGDDRLEAVTTLAPRLGSVKVFYARYGSRASRRALEGLTSTTHELYRSLSFLEHGNSIYLRRDLADHPDANRRLLELFAGGAAF
jgi:hypothetical protein